MHNITPISLYVHIPWCIKKCPYCDFNSHQLKTGANSTDTVDLDLQNNYVDALILDLKQSVERYGRKNLNIKTIFIGGGTPSLFSGKSIDKLLTETDKLIPIENNVEITLEANPGTFERQKFADFKTAGINRLSIGVQSFNNDCLKKLGRIHDNTQAIQAIIAAKNLGFNLNIDLMHTLPDQTEEIAISDLKTALELEPNHLSWYQLTIEPNTQFAKQPPLLPKTEIEDNIYHQGLDFIKKNNFIQYEISAFAQSNNFITNQAQHNLNYWRYGDYLGIGAGAHSKLTINNIVQRQWKQKSPVRYLDFNCEKLSGYSNLSANDILLEYMMNKLRILEPLHEEELYNYTHFTFNDIDNQIRQAQNNHWVTVNNKQLLITDIGRRFLNDIILLFV